MKAYVNGSSKKFHSNESRKKELHAKKKIESDLHTRLDSHPKSLTTIIVPVYVLELELMSNCRMKNSAINW